MPPMSPVERVRQKEMADRKWRMRADELQMANALLDLLENGSDRLPRSGRGLGTMRIQALFDDEDDRSISRGVMSRVLAKAGIEFVHRVQPWQLHDGIDDIRRVRDGLIQAR